ncbi:MAG: 2-amino-4-hydroxy-6-hydroxymethyldihydropteridine diphosphokinase, partial [Gammaproteobacteria bacterium]|nr:2-amino-4-hydroxy-6-hydroxymethyldihydropteridine diphosphokinase [Gammaproteobacteria bacterium]
LGVTLPHPRFHERPFVLYPLYECVPNLILPDGVRLRELRNAKKIIYPANRR